LKNTIFTQKILECLFTFGFVFSVHAQTKVEKAPVKASSNVTKPQSAGAIVYRKNVESIVLIDAEDSSGRRQGSGVAIRNGLAKSPDGKLIPSSTWIVTNAHVVKDAKVVSVMVAGFLTKGEVQFRDVQMDIAFVYIDGTVVKPVELTEQSTVLSPGDVVFAIGAPQGLTRSITDGVVSSMRTIDGIRLIQTSAPISPGSSGGGLFSSSGDLAGVTTFKVVGGDSLNFAVEITQVRKLLAAHDAAVMMKIGIDPQYQSIFGDEFARWVYSASGETGGTVLDEFREAEARWLRNEMPFEKWIDKQFEISNRYYEFVNSSKASNSQSANGGSRNKSKLVLICQLFGASNGQPQTQSYEIDYERETINRYSAKIDPNIMKYSYKNNRGTEYTVVFDRNAATATVSTEQFPRLLQGKCSKSEGKVF
jgi:Trypsin-like peptidase domain